MERLNKLWRAGLTAIILGSSAGFATTVKAAPELLPGTYRCSAYNVSGGGGSCRTMPPLVLRADGSYEFSSTRGRWTVHGGKLVLSESRIWGAGEILGGNAVRFEYDYRGWRHTVTWSCQECASANHRTADHAGGAYVGVSLTLQFAQPVGGVSGYTIVPAEFAGSYAHNAPLPDGAVQGLAWEAGPDTVRVATNRNNKLLSGRRYVVFLSWPRESIPVAVLEIPPTDRDYTATFSATLDGAILTHLHGGHAPTAPPGPPLDQPPQALPPGTYTRFPPPPPETPQGYPPLPPVTQGGAPEGTVPAAPDGSAPTSPSGSAGGSGFQGFINAMDQLGKALEGLKRRDKADRNPAYPGSEPSGSYPPAQASSYPGSGPPVSYPPPPSDYPPPGSSLSNPPGYPASPTPTYDPGGAVPVYGSIQRGQGATPPPPPKCDPHIPKYSQPGCVE